MKVLYLIILAVCSYLFGNINFAKIISKCKKDDISYTFSNGVYDSEIEYVLFTYLKNEPSLEDIRSGATSGLKENENKEDNGPKFTISKRAWLFIAILGGAVLIALVFVSIIIVIIIKDKKRMSENNK